MPFFLCTCSSYHLLHHVAGKVVALAEFEEYGESYARDIVQNARALGQSLVAEGFDVLAESRNIRLRIKFLQDMVILIQVLAQLLHNCLKMQVLLPI